MACVLLWMSMKESSERKNFIFTKRKIDKEELVISETLTLAHPTWN